MNALQKIESEAMHLLPAERALLARHLIDSLEGEQESNVDELWIKEAERRYQAYQRGEMEAIPAEDLLANARKNLK